MTSSSPRCLLTYNNMLSYHPEVSSEESDMVKRTCVWIIEKMSSYAVDQGWPPEKILKMSEFHEKDWKKYIKFIRQVLVVTPWISTGARLSSSKIKESASYENIVEIITSPSKKEAAVTDYMKNLKNALSDMGVDSREMELEKFFTEMKEPGSGQSSTLSLMPTYRRKGQLYGSFLSMAVTYSDDLWLDKLLRKYFNAMFHASIKFVYLKYFYDIDKWRENGIRLTRNLNYSVVREVEI